MRVNIVRIGNSQGIRLPKALLQQCSIQDCVELAVADNVITLQPCHAHPRQGWAGAFAAMHREGHEVDWNEAIDAEMDDWRW
jgi:antitoxin MazE